MKIALYGTQLDELSKSKARLESNLGDARIQVNIDCYTEKEMLEKNLYSYDIVLLAEGTIDKLGIISKKRSVSFVWGKTIENCYIDDIYYVEAELKNVHIREKKRDLIIHLPISQVEKILESEGFIKIHRSYIVNQLYIQSIHGNLVYLEDGTELPISKYRMKDVYEKYLEYRNCL